jgi:hypothetical protein
MASMPATESEEGRWLLLIHQIPAQPSYLRVKVWRRLQAIGAVAVKKSVYVLPDGDEAAEHFEWLVREIEKEGGEAGVCRGRFVQGLSDEQVRALFVAARDAEYHLVAEDARRITARLSRKRTVSASERTKLATEAGRLRRRVSDVASIDFFGASGREVASGLVDELERSLGGGPRARGAARGSADLRGHTWVTRKGIHVDRIATAWLIRRFIDPDAPFKFVSSRGHRPGSNELRFDMFDGEFTHEGDRCTFEVLLARTGLDDSALHRIAEIVHDIDLRDAKFDVPETAGVERLLTGLAARHRDDEVRLAKGTDLFDDLYESFRSKRR